MNKVMRRLGMMLCFFVSVVSAELQLSGLSLNTPQKIEEPVRVTFVRDATPPPDTVTAVLTLHMKKDVHCYAAESLFFRLAIDSLSGLEGGRITLPEPHSYTNFDRSKVDVFIDGQSFVMKQHITAPEWKLTGTVQYQACDGRMCFTPKKWSFTVSSAGAPAVHPAGEATIVSTAPLLTNDSTAESMLAGFAITGTRGGFLSAEKFRQFLEAPSQNEHHSLTAFENRGLLVVILLILLGGIALNLTPCVLPMIPITIAIIGAGVQAKSKARGMFIGGVYGAAMAITYGILGIAVVLTGTRFGVINASPVFNLIIAGIFILMALAMFDVIVIDFNRFRKAGVADGARDGNVVTVFVMGCIAALLAGACVAPVVIAVVLYAGSLYAQGNIVGLLLPLFLGIGMALPWPFAGAGLSLLPKPGKWMVWIKYVFGIFILVMALYYGITGIGLLRKTPESVSTPHLTSTSDVVWLTDLKQGLLKAELENRPLLIDCWATWCKNCKAMEATTLRDPKVAALLANYVCVRYQAEHPDEPGTKRILDHFKAIGLPTFVILEKNRK